LLGSRTKRLKPNAAQRPFQTAIGAMTVGCILLGLVALLHEDSPIARLVAERAQDRQSGRLAALPSASEIGATSALVARALPSSLRSSGPPNGAIDDVPTFWDQPVARSGNDVGHFWNAAQSVTQSDRGPIIQLGPLFDGKDSADADGSQARTSERAADPAPLVTRTYRPASMSAVSLERLVRPLLTPRGETIATNSDSSRPTDPPPAADQTRAITDAESAKAPGVLVVSDRPEAIGRVDALCHDLESMSPQIAIELVVVSVMPNTSRQLPWDQWRNSFGSVASDLPHVLSQIRRLGGATVRARSQLQGISGTWTELECSSQSLLPKSERSDSTGSADREAANVLSSPTPSAVVPSTVTTLRIRPSAQSGGTIRIELRAQSSHVEDHAQSERSQFVTVRFNTEVVLREGATGIVNLFVDEPFNSGSVPANPGGPAAAAFVIPGGPSIPLTQIVPQPAEREQTLLLLMPRIAGPPRGPGKIAVSKARNPA
jgi:hypothetical protein